MLLVKKITPLLILLILSGLSFSQIVEKEDNLYDRVMENQELMQTDMEQAFLNIEALLKEAITTNDHPSELTLLANKCRFFVSRRHVSELIKTAEHLYAQSVKYKDIRLQAVAKKYIADGYRLNGLYENAIRELNLSLSILEKADPNDDNIKNTRANTYISLANLYADQEEYATGVQQMILAGKEFNTLINPKHKAFLTYVNNSNIAAMYAELDADSAMYYVQKSIRQKPETNAENDVTTRRNYIILGIIHKNKREYAQAIHYLTEAERMTYEIGDRLNLQQLYSVFIEIYKQNNDTEPEAKYLSKLQALELELAQDKNKSLHEIIAKEEKRKQQTTKELRNKILIWTGIALVLLFVLFFWYRRNTHTKYEKLSEAYLKKNAISNTNKDQLYNELIEMIKNNDPGLIALFNQAHPEFTHKLTTLHPDLTQSEIEFCILLKLNLTTKEIARYRFIEPKTVQNKKYRIRKKLDIPNAMDIYQWFNTL